MADSSHSVVTRLLDRVFPRMPDFYGLINAQCAHLAQAMDVFVKFMENHTKECGDQVRAMEKEGDALKAKHIAILNHAFATPMDREDIYRAIVTIDEILNYAKTTVREIEVLEVEPDEYMAKMARLIRDGSVALGDGYKKLSTDPMDAEENAVAAHKAERSVEKVYRAALAELFSPDRHAQDAEQPAENAQRDAMGQVIEIFKRREVYRHLSNAADRLEHAASVLQDTIVQIA